MKTDILCAYFAGVIDSDGFISAHRRKHLDRVYCAPLIGISGTSPEPHQLAQSIWGGSFFPYTPKNPAHRVQYQWQATGKSAAIAIHDIQPYLLTKGQQATIALEMWSLISAGMHRTDLTLFAMSAELSSLNLRNPPLKVTA